MKKILLCNGIIFLFLFLPWGVEVDYDTLDLIKINGFQYFVLDKVLLVSFLAYLIAILLFVKKRKVIIMLFASSIISFLLGILVWHAYYSILQIGFLISFSKEYGLFLSIPLFLIINSIYIHNYIYTNMSVQK
ncbi:hypothetical protein M2139_002669 [Enterococcus sp. PF1-24]|uniref:hypothetical protein n=1 Tax=unclassified Enterococcus TaxID=2608891 RepID=UPI00247472A2|nr:MULTISPECIES: hypothetical protein [unclassified Enterococcus]MDH6365655.1 hypothetical protein [Enterococcus sp. PFB1-1]MDH6402763.1 hypothetical protein [Enterococcus sp. PF1-24]